MLQHHVLTGSTSSACRGDRRMVCYWKVDRYLLFGYSQLISYCSCDKSQCYNIVTFKIHLLCRNEEVSEAVNNRYFLSKTENPVLG
jgi:hypothetical protein